ncbi:MAG: hypothetical protein IT379_27970 [Deltaproteobacteria bacterium]|nr:hypothetical protein [Deltaproteobacteria bacterium]
MRVLVTWGSKRGGTEGIARIVGDVLEAQGFDVTLAPARSAKDVASFDAVVVGGALYANRWPAEARRFVSRNVASLRKVPVWFFSSGPLDDSASRREIPAPTEISVLAERIGARAHVTFGGRLEPNAKGFPASAMAKTHSGDWRDPDRVRAWASALAMELPEATPGHAVDHPGRALPRLVTHAVLGWAVSAAMMLALPVLLGRTGTVVLHAILTPIVFAVLAWSYFRVRGSRAPLATAVAWTAIVALLDLGVVSALVLRSFDALTSLGATWLPYGLVLLVTWAAGSIVSTMPWPKPTEGAGMTDKPAV